MENQIKRIAQLNECIGFQKAVLELQDLYDEGFEIEEIHQILVSKSIGMADAARDSGAK